MLHIHFSNRYEILTRQLLSQLGTGTGGALAADEVIVPSAAVRRSLTLAIADAHGVCSNVRFSYLARWLWQQMAALVPGVAPESPFVPDVLVWRVHSALGDPTFVAAHPRLAAYVVGADDVMRFDLASRVAGLFDQYITYRPDWLAAWRLGRTADLHSATQGERADERWQAALWRRLVESAGAPAADPVNPAAAFIDALKRTDATQARAAGLPACAHVYALPAMPPLHIAWLKQIGRLMDVHVYVLNPCEEHWFELIDRRRLSHLAARGRARDTQHLEEGNRLLAAWGRQTQAHIDGLVDGAGEDATDDSTFEAHGAGTLLAQLQNAILRLEEMTPGSVQLPAGDRSIEVHACHSLTRELEALHDHLLGLLASGAVRHPSQVLVVTPDLDAAAPLIEAVFGTAPRERHIPFTISGRARSQASAPARGLLGLLSLVVSRFSASAVFGMLQQSIVARRFGLDDERLQQVHDWLRASGTRWGLDGPNRASFGVPATPEHTWAEGLDRLYLGYALPSEVPEPFAGMLPAGDAEGSDAVTLGAFWSFVEELRALHEEVAVSRAPEAWRRLLLAAVDSFMTATGDELEDQRELLQAIDALTQAMQRGGLGEAGAKPVPLAVVRKALEQQLDDPARGGVPTGGVTFSSMSSLRGLPFEVICVIGLDDGAFPTSRRPPEFDLMNLLPRRGDRQRRSDERNLLLDLLLAARHSVYLSYKGRSVRDNTPLPPSVLVSELLELLCAAIAEDPAAPHSLQQARKRLLVEHPLQPFAIEGFDPAGDPRLRSFHRELADALRSSLQAAPVAAAPREEATAPAALPEPDEEDAAIDTLPAFFTGALAAPSAEWREPSIEQLIEFFRNPCRYLLKRRLGIELARAADELQDEEPFLPDWPGRNALAARLLGPLLAGADVPAVRKLAEAGNEMPSGALGRYQLDLEIQSLGAFAAKVCLHTGAPCLPPHQVRLGFEIEGESWQLLASFADLRADGLVRWRYDSLRAGDVLAAWIAHLAFCAAPPAGAAPQTRWLSLDGTLHLRMPEQPAALLQDLLRLYRRGLCEPLEFFPKSAWSYMNNGESLYAAHQVWTPTRDRPFAEGADPAYRLALRGRGDALAGEFEDLAQRVFSPVFAAESTPVRGAQATGA